jgi:hypothetical protein
MLYAAGKIEVQKYVSGKRFNRCRLSTVGCQIPGSFALVLRFWNDLNDLNDLNSHLTLKFMYSVPYEVTFSSSATSILR